MKFRILAIAAALIAVACIGRWLLSDTLIVESSAQPNAREAAESQSPAARTPASASRVENPGAIEPSLSAREASISPTEVMARSPSAAAAIASLRSMEPSKDVADALVVASAACAESARWRAADGEGPWKGLATSWDQAHQEQIVRFLTWCGDLDALRLARVEAVRKSALGIPGDSDQDRAQALLDDASGILAPEHQDEALALLFETTSLAVADGLASGLFHLAKMPATESQRSTLIADQVRPTNVVSLATAMIYCRNSALCSPNHPRTMLDCVGSGLCAVDRRLIDFRYAMANSFERELAETLVADWTRRRRGIPQGN